MTKHHSSLSPSQARPTLSPQEQQGLLRGITLERSHPWRSSLRFALFVMPTLWILLTVLFVLLGQGVWAILDALAWSLLASTIITLLYHVLYPALLDPPRLRLRNETLQVQSGPHDHWMLPLDEPFSLHLLYRDYREDALLVVQPAEAPPLFLYGRYRKHRYLPETALVVDPLGFSLAEVALDQIGAWMLPDREAEYLAPLATLLMEAPGCERYEFALPLAPSPYTLRLTHHHISYFFHNERLGHFPLDTTQVEAYRVPSSSFSGLLLELIDADNESGWIVVEWPLPVPSLQDLDEAPGPVPTTALSLPPLDAVLFLHYLDTQEILLDATLLLQSKKPSEPPTESMVSNSSASEIESQDPESIRPD
ncbi:MAG: hypothetical protein EP343_00495 [Deltaproteobacteria bacterium]|nr:MAG: hypothetical protein EP343_00495 [Deltaproteobacteria bacterium]